MLSALGKIYTSILNNRLHEYMVQKGILKAEQCGFRKMYATVDSIFTLKTLIDKYVKSKPQKHRNLLFSCFVDFRKAFDCIPREKLVDKQNKEGVHGRFFDVLIFMYSTDKSEVKIDDKLTQSFACKEKVPCCHLLFLISIGSTTHVTMDMCFPAREKHITMDMCCAGRGTHITGKKVSLGICVSQVGEHISLGICVSQVGEHISLGICVSQVREHISVGICVSQVGEHISLGILVSQVGELICRRPKP